MPNPKKGRAPVPAANPVDTDTIPVVRDSGFRYVFTDFANVVAVGETLTIWFSQLAYNEKREYVKEERVAVSTSIGHAKRLMDRMRRQIEQNEQWHGPARNTQYVKE